MDRLQQGTQSTLVQKGYEEGLKEEAKERAKQEQETQEKIAVVNRNCDNVLLQIKTVFPFDLFPDTIIIDENKVSIVHKTFFASESITSILLKELTDVSVETNIFFAKLNFTYSHHPMRPMYESVSFLRKAEALESKRILEGLLVLRIGEHVDLQRAHPAERVSEIERLGQDISH